MSDPFVGEIRMFAGNFAPRQWALCDGQLLGVSSNDALFSLLGTIYGGDGRTTFGLPDLRGRIPIHAGSGPGLTPRRLGERSGTETVSLSSPELPNHNHPPSASGNVGSTPSPEGAGFAAVASGQPYHNSPTPAAIVTLPTAAVGTAGSSQAHTNLQPFQCINFIIALSGVYPSRT